METIVLRLSRLENFTLRSCHSSVHLKTRPVTNDGEVSKLKFRGKSKVNTHGSILQRYYYDSFFFVLVWGFPNLDHFKINRLDQLSPLKLCPFLSTHDRHHVNIARSEERGAVPVWENRLIQ